MNVLGAIVSGIASHIAHFLHPDKPREFFKNVEFPTDLSVDQVSHALDEAAKANPGFKDWRRSIVDLMKLSHPDDPDGASSKPNRKALAAELGRPDYDGKDDENIWLHGEVFKALQQRGIPLPQAG